MRLDKFLAETNKESRSELKKIIKNGLITVNGAVAKSPDAKVDELDDVITFRGKTICYEPFVYFMLNKPAGLVSATEDCRERTVIDLFREEQHRALFPVGRLDKDSEGLLLITDDGKLAHELLSPKKHVPKTYYVRLDGRITPEQKTEFASGIYIGDDKQTLPAQLEILSETSEELGHATSEALITITEGRFHQVKRMFAAYSQQVTYLKRIAMGRLSLDDTLQPGEYRRLTGSELDLLKQEYIC